MITNRLLETDLIRCYKLVLILAIATCSLAASAPLASTVRLAIVNGDTITATDMDRLLISSHRSMSSDKKEAFEYRKLLEKLVNDRLIIQEAKTMGMDEEEDFVERLQDDAHKKARRLFVRETFHPTLEISEDEITRQFERFYWKMQVRTIGVSTAAEAARLLAEVKAGVSMDSIAREVSLDSRRFKGGLHNFKYWKDVVMEVREVALHLRVGDLSTPFRFRDAHMILRVEQRADADPTERDYFVKEIKQVLTNERRTSAWNHFLDSLAGQFPAVVDSSVLALITADSAKVFLGDFLRGSDRCVVRIGAEEIISEQTLRREISHSAMNAGDQAFSEILTTAMEGAIHQSRLIIAAIEQGYLNHPTILEHLASLRDSLLVQTYLNENIVGQMAFNREEFEKYYDENLEQFREPSEVRLAVLQLSNQADADQAAALLSDGADFDYVANRLSHKHENEPGQDENKWFSIETFPSPVAAALKHLAIGKSSEPFALSEGWVVFKLTGRREGALKSMADVDGQIREVMFQRQFTILLNELLASLKEAAYISYDEDAIAVYLGEAN